MTWANDSELWTTAQHVCTPAQLRVLTLRYQHGMSLRTIAKTIDRDEATVRGHHDRALRRIRRAQEKAA